MLLIIPATRNSILAVGFGVAFDHVVVYHRFIGRFAIMCVVVHFGYFFKNYNINQFTYFTGLGSMLCGFVIFATSMDYFRRNFFNIFYWSHYSFVGFLILAYFHCSQTKPFILTGIAIYISDKLLRMLWMLWPQELLLFQPKGSSVAQVRFPKNPITKLFGMHHVGQYYFVNFPALSLTEWVSFNLSKSV
jgi:hypothetical protein